MIKYELIIIDDVDEHAASDVNAALLSVLDTHDNIRPLLLCDYSSCRSPEEKISSVSLLADATPTRSSEPSHPASSCALPSSRYSRGPSANVEAKHIPLPATCEFDYQEGKKRTVKLVPYVLSGFGFIVIHFYTVQTIIYLSRIQPRTQIDFTSALTFPIAYPTTAAATSTISTSHINGDCAPGEASRRVQLPMWIVRQDLKFLELQSILVVEILRKERGDGEDGVAWRWRQEGAQIQSRQARSGSGRRVPMANGDVDVNIIIIAASNLLSNMVLVPVPGHPTAVFVPGLKYQLRPLAPPVCFLNLLFSVTIILNTTLTTTLALTDILDPILIALNVPRSMRTGTGDFVQTHSHNHGHACQHAKLGYWKLSYVSPVSHFSSHGSRAHLGRNVFK
ncbi:hypothetical protein CPB84DRAFT_1849423 [Gymnopilus junonius]|uniref:Uncharacterized protein n=1 Tax=Gymnopilus junonius TaxID=109634 RepID=A0A9P5TJN5_GYMJU|nr:hypothetical protein CPB84DRAFT_1849423 [Gymnopilus junonius]